MQWKSGQIVMIIEEMLSCLKEQVVTAKRRRHQRILQKGRPPSNGGGWADATCLRWPNITSDDAGTLTSIPMLALVPLG